MEKKIITLYLSGPYFTNAEVKQQRQLASKIRELFEENNIELNLFSPLELNENTPNLSKQPLSYFHKNYLHFMETADIAVVVLDNLTPEALLEFGYLTSIKKKVNNNLRIIVYETGKELFKTSKFLTSLIEDECIYTRKLVNLLAKLNDITKSL